MRGSSARGAGIAVIFFLFFLEITLFKRLGIFGARPELLLIASVFFGFYFGPSRGAEIGVLSGVLKDIFSITTFGVNTFSFLLIGCLAGLLRGKLSKESVLTQFLFSGVSACVISGIYFAYLAGILKCPPAGDFWRLCAIKALYTGCAAPVIFFILRRIITRETNAD